MYSKSKHPNYLATHEMFIYWHFTHSQSPLFIAGSFYRNILTHKKTVKKMVKKTVLIIIFRGTTHMIVYTVGTFDLLHVGHLALLKYCKSLGGVLAVGVASDRVVNSYKPNVPVIPLEQRMEMLIDTKFSKPKTLLQIL
jgi:cytidyltransferase-like protein